MNLDRYGAACRCLLRIRENQGNPVISDGAFIAEHLSLYPDWEYRPGAGDVRMIFAIGEELGVCSGGEVVRDYDRVLALHRAGKEILIRTEVKPATVDHSVEENFALIVEMDETDLVLWQPSNDGFSETRSFKQERYWIAAKAEAIVLLAPKAVEKVR